MVAFNLVIDLSAFTVSLLDGRTCNLRFPKVDALVSLNLDDGVVPWCGYLELICRRKSVPI